MKKIYKKLFIALSLTLILCSCGTSAQETDATIEVHSHESIHEDTKASVSTQTETKQSEVTQDSVPIESAPEESIPSPEPSSRESSSQETSPQEASTGEVTTPEYTIEPMERIMYAQKAVNLRKGPSTDYPKAGSLTKGQEVHVIGKASTGWYQLENELFVSGSYLGDSAPAPEPVPEPIAPAPEPAQPTTSSQSFIDEVVNLVNAERANEGLGALTLDGTVQAAATVRVNECVSSFSHTRPSGAAFYTALDEQGASYSTAGENIAYGQTSPQEVVTAWMNSPGHRDNIMNGAFTCIGVGYCTDGSGTAYWCQVFTG